MITASEKSKLIKKLEEYEGRYNHMYLDSNGYVTIGVGHLIKNIESAINLNFKRISNEHAKRDEIKSDFDTLKKQSKGYKASYYKRFVKLTLSEADIDFLTNKHIITFEGELKRLFPEFKIYPTEVRLALFDIIFNVGMTDLNTKWPKFKKAIKDNDWATAAKESNRKSPIQAERNKYVKDLLNKAESNANKK
ncbi:hypothetical protein [Photobacterium nomapromontoriensis]|uniref:hypothetical protein n=1 Tax=Photobacterium nomapromontoriensis TaxID=2910237 RepID=UPI003D0FFE34